MMCKPGLRQFGICYDHRTKTRPYEISQAGGFANAMRAKWVQKEVQNIGGMSDRTEFTSHNRTRGCGEFMTRVLVAS